MSFQHIPESYGESLTLLEIGSSFQNEIEEEKYIGNVQFLFKYQVAHPVQKF